MRNIKVMIILFLLFGFASVNAQQNSSANGSEVTKSSNEMVDPNLSAEEQSEMLNAGQDNPAKIDESQMVDPNIDPATLPTEEDYGESNAKPELIDDQNEVNTPATKTKSVQKETRSQSTQPRGEKADNVVNYRNMSGPNNQPKGKEAGKVTNYRGMKGSNSQPLPKKSNDPIQLN